MPRRRIAFSLLQLLMAVALAVIGLGLAVSVLAARRARQAQNADWVRSLAISPDGRTLVTGSDKGTIKFWSVANGRLLGQDTATWSGSGHSPRLAFSPDGSLLAAGSGEQIGIWDARTGDMRRALAAPGFSLSSFSPDGGTLLSASNIAVQLWDTATWHERAELQRAPAPRAFSPDRRTLATGTLDETFHVSKAITLWDVSSGQKRATLPGDPDDWAGLNCLAFSPDGQTLASGGPRGEIKMWDVAAGVLTTTLRAKDAAVSCIVFSPDGRTMASGHADNRVRLWEVASGAVASTLTGHVKPISTLAFSPDGTKLVSQSDEDLVAIVWDVRDARPINALRQDTARFIGPAVSPVAFSSEGTPLLAAAEHRGAISVWDAATGRRVALFRGAVRVDWGFYGIAAAVWLATWCAIHRRGTVRFAEASSRWLWRHRAGLLLAGAAASILLAMAPFLAGAIATPPDEFVWAIAMLPGGEPIAVSESESEDDFNAIYIWNVRTRKQRLQFTTYDYLQAIRFSPDGRWMAAFTLEADRVRVWDMQSGRLRATLQGHRHWISDMAFSPDGRTLATASWDKTVKLWEIPTGRELATLKGHRDAVMSLAFSPNGRTLASADNENTIKLWDLATGKARRTMVQESGFYDKPERLIFAPDGRSLISGDGSVKIWDVATGRRRAAIEVHGLHGMDSPYTVFEGMPNYRFAVSPSGKTLAVVEWDDRPDSRLIGLFDVATGTRAATLTHDDDVYCLAFSHDSRLLATGSEGTVNVWDAATGELRKTFTGHSGSVGAVAFSADDRMLASLSDGVRIWDLETARQLQATEDFEWDEGGHFGFSNDGRFLVAETTVWDVATGKQIAIARKRTAPLRWQFVALAILLVLAGTCLAARNRRARPAKGMQRVAKA